MAVRNGRTHLDVVIVGFCDETSDGLKAYLCIDWRVIGWSVSWFYIETSRP